MRQARALTAALAILSPVPGASAHAQTMVSSPAPDRVAVTVYRDPQRPPGRALNLEWLDGYALITETRRIAIPAGEAEIRFEGVAGGIIPQSAIVTGIPDGVVERNRDAYLLSPGTLYDRSLGRRVLIRRTSRATGAVREQEAVIRSGAGGAMVVQTAEGVEALRCTGLDETLVYPSVPAGLSARPTLSVRTRANAPATANVTLSYLASGFDWQANYVVNLTADGRHADVFAWLTLANSDETGFADADTQAVAGRLNRERVDRTPSQGDGIDLRCWPAGRSNDALVLLNDRVEYARRGVVADDEDSSIVVTGSMIARREELGDLKLYRIPEPVTVAANSQKQVAMIEQHDVRVGFLYRQQIDAQSDDDEPQATRRLLVTRNRTAEGLGLPLPGGRVVAFANAGARPILLGEGWIDDRAVGEDVEIPMGESSGVTTRTERLSRASDEANRPEEYQLVVANHQPAPVRFEASFSVDEERVFAPRRRLARRAGRPLWTVMVPANGTVVLRYRLTQTAG